MGAVRAVTFDAGQTLVDLDVDLLAARLGERGSRVAPAALAAALAPAWQRYDDVVRAGVDHPWRAFMTALLVGAGAGDRAAELADWLWHEQPRRNLWRAPIADMVALARELAAAGVRVAVLSNSEGRLAELLAEIGIADPFVAVIDSGVVGVEKPDRRIFEHALAAVGVPAADAVHIGDSWPADIAGALAAGWRAIWYGRSAAAVDDARVGVARDAGEVRAALARFGHASPWRA